MPIYDKPVRLLIPDLISSLAPTQAKSFSREEAIEWFARNYPKIKEGTITAHLIRFSTNAPSRLHYSVRSDEDLLYQIDGSHFRPFDPARDPAPIHSKSDINASPGKPSETTESANGSEFAYESDLRT
jgi:endonuclease